jgi:hypothetical protein
VKVLLVLDEERLSVRRCDERVRLKPDTTEVRRDGERSPDHPIDGEARRSPDDLIARSPDRQEFDPPPLKGRPTRSAFLC